MFSLRIISRRSDGLISLILLQKIHLSLVLVTKLGGPWPLCRRVSPRIILHRELADLGVKSFNLAILIFQPS